MIYRFTLKPCGAVGTPFRSDTLFGHACWAIRLYEDETRFDQFMENARKQQPELVFSDGFPEGYLPRPLVPGTQQESKTPEGQRRIKKLSKLRWVKRIEAERKKWKIDQSFLSEDTQHYSQAPLKQVHMHNSINRLTAAALDGTSGLFTKTEEWYAGMWERIDIYVSTQWGLDRLAGFLHNMFRCGYGRDQASGYGAVMVYREPEADNFTPYDSNLFMSLSCMVPDNTVTLDTSFYDIEPKYGKVWSGLAHKNPFKKTVLQTVPGSVFIRNTAGERAGRVLSDIHEDPCVIENCMTIVYPLPEEITSEVYHG